MSEHNPIQAAAESSSDTPAALDSDGGGVAPSLSTRQIALVLGAVVVGVLVIAWLRRQQSGAQSTAGETLGDVRTQLNDDAEGEETGAEGPITGEIEIPRDPSDPMAADEAVTEALRERGVINDTTEET